MRIFSHAVPAPLSSAAPMSIYSLLCITSLMVSFAKFLTVVKAPPPSPAIPPVSKVPSVRIHPPSPSKSISLIHQYIYQSQLQFLYHGRLVDLPASPQCGCISVPCCALCGSVSWQQTTAMTGLQGRESLLLRSSLAQARVADILSHSWRVL